MPLDPQREMVIQLERARVRSCVSKCDNRDRVCVCARARREWLVFGNCDGAMWARAILNHYLERAQLSAAVRSPVGDAPCLLPSNLRVSQSPWPLNNQILCQVEDNVETVASQLFMLQ